MITLSASAALEIALREWGKSVGGFGVETVRMDQFIFEVLSSTESNPGLFLEQTSDLWVALYYIPVFPD